ncbi:hypothetical protein [Mycolicibacterium stellerae]|uniref:hypothetical protein n=1 Tax=Mycolicibacterium stellerae TaxID=2358193 RepID=UPI000F0B3E7F|nr:hypothetical protein [Mycolicibacterium stellerae]
MNAIGKATIAGLAAVFAFSFPATSSAAPREWDIGEYDSCIKKVADRNAAGITNDAQMLDEAKHCCAMSGGEWDIHAAGPAGKCVAPPKEQAGPRTLPSGAPVQTFQPAPAPVQDPGDVTQTFAPASVD